VVIKEAKTCSIVQRNLYILILYYGQHNAPRFFQTSGKSIIRAPLRALSKQPCPPMTTAPIARATQDRTAGRQSPKLISLHMRASGRVSALEGRSKRTGMGRKHRSGKEGSETTPHCLDCFRPERKLAGRYVCPTGLSSPFPQASQSPLSTERLSDARLGGAFDDGFDFVGAYRLAEIVIHTRRQAKIAVFFHRIGGHGNNIGPFRRTHA
jgi:hypothetical protein